MGSFRDFEQKIEGKAEKIKGKTEGGLRGAVDTAKGSIRETVADEKLKRDQDADRDDDADSE